MAPSLSARRAWIEIADTSKDRHGLLPSLSARRAWIEIFFAQVIAACIQWSLSARRAWIEIVLYVRNSGLEQRRSPQGERG